MVGLWLLGIKRELVDLHRARLGSCGCRVPPKLQDRFISRPYYVTLSYPFCFISLQPKRKHVPAF